MIQALLQVAKKHGCMKHIREYVYEDIVPNSPIANY